MTKSSDNIVNSLFSGRNEFFKQLNTHYFSEVFNCLPDIYYFSKNRKGEFVGMNSALIKAIGLKYEYEVLGKTDYDFFDIRLADRYRDEDLLIMEKGPLLDRIWHVPDGEGRLRWYLSSKYPLIDQSKHIVGIVGLMRDVQRAGPALGPYEDFSAVLKFIHDFYSEQIKIPDLAKMLFISVSLFERRFKDLFKMTPIQYINKVRLDAASELLTKDNLSITEISQKCGFYDHTYFSKRFKSEFSLSPKIYRKKYSIKQ